LSNQTRTLLERIATEARLSNPNANPEEIVEGIKKTINEEIIPRVIKNIALPKFPSYREIELAQFKRIKVKPNAKTEMGNNLGSRRSLIQQIEGIRNDMGWDGINDTRPQFFLNDSPNIISPMADLPITRPLGKKRELKEKEREDNQEVADTIAKEKPGETSKNVISLSESTQRKIVIEPIFGKFFENVELQLRDTIAKRQLETEIDVECKNDIEFSSWNKCVIKIHMKKSMEFNEKMNISTVFDVTIRKQLNELKKNADEGTVKYLDALNKNLFVHIDL
jgi:hypothetical protein